LLILVSFAAGRGCHRNGDDRIVRRHQGSHKRKFFDALIRHARSLPSPREPHPIAMIGPALWRALVPRIGLPAGAAHAKLPTGILAVSLASEARNAHEERPLTPAASKI
jgi:hypothetical protein